MLAAFLLVAFSLGTVYDVCAYTDWQTSNSQFSSSLSTDSAPPSSSDLGARDCHCLCHFAFQPANHVSVKTFTRHQSHASLLKESIKEPASAGILRPPIVLL